MNIPTASPDFLFYCRQFDPLFERNQALTMNHHSPRMRQPVLKREVPYNRHYHDRRPDAIHRTMTPFALFILATPVAGCDSFTDSIATRVEVREYQYGMDEEVQQLLQKHRYSAALERVLDVYEKKVFGMAVMMLRDAGRAEEVTQDVFFKVWRALPGYNGRASIATWLYTIARNTCLSAVRAESYRKTASLDDVSEPSAPNVLLPNLALKDCLSKLPECQRAVITLFYLQERSVKEVAKMLDLPEGTVKSHLHRARRTLGAMME